MARIRMLTSVAGADFSWEAGQVVDLPGAEATAWADGVRAVMVRTVAAETPEDVAPERAARKRRPAKTRTAE
ncbi:hypothetical protein ABZ791_30130 [Streptomyces huasconensis]|uniref:Uncharacterized protein n=1 Tax=Streptomyces huasconensis TaxID=1854574 RepID=A0ABV3M2Z0_9ACTN